MRILQPNGWKQPSGFSQGVLAEGRVIFVAGQVGWNANNEMTSPDFVGQARQALQNIVAILAEGGAEPRHITRLDWFVVDVDEYAAAAGELGQVYREVIGNHYPAMMLLGISKLLEEGARLEIEATAIIPT